MEPLAVDLLLLRSLARGGDLRIAPGRVLMARVVEAGAHGRGTLSIAGQLVEAGLPTHVRKGEELRLVVRELTGDRVVLGLADPPPPATAPPAAPLPGGGRVAVTERDAAAAGTEGSPTHTVTLRYDAPALGPVDLRFMLDAGSLQLAVTVAAGDALARAGDAADELRQALAAEVQRAVTVTVSPRRDPVDLYA